MSGKNLKNTLYDIVFESDTRKGKAFDLILLVIILLSVILVIVESVPRFRERYGEILHLSEWIITIIFTAEYILRLFITRRPIKYVFSFFGIVDLLSVIPTYLSLILTGAQGLMVIRAIRLLRVFRIMKLNRYTNEGSMIIKALQASKVKISVFLFAILMVILIIGTLMYLVEGEANGFTSIPVGIYWAIVTLTTVGYGDITPLTELGKFISSFVMILGYAIIAVPTGIVTAELVNFNKKHDDVRVCPDCFNEDNDKDAKFCKKCGGSMLQ
jgi:voltage-gated potassium channel